MVLKAEYIMIWWHDESVKWMKWENATMSQYAAVSAFSKLYTIFRSISKSSNSSNNNRKLEKLILHRMASSLWLTSWFQLRHRTWQKSTANQIMHEITLLSY